MRHLDRDRPSGRKVFALVLLLLVCEASALQFTMLLLVPGYADVAVADAQLRYSAHDALRARALESGMATQLERDALIGTDMGRRIAAQLRQKVPRKEGASLTLALQSAFQATCAWPIALILALAARTGPMPRAPWTMILGVLLAIALLGAAGSFVGGSLTYQQAQGSPVRPSLAQVLYLVSVREFWIEASVPGAFSGGIAGTLIAAVMGAWLVRRSRRREGLDSATEARHKLAQRSRELAESRASAGAEPNSNGLGDGWSTLPLGDYMDGAWSARVCLESGEVRFHGSGPDYELLLDSGEAEQLAEFATARWRELLGVGTDERYHHLTNVTRSLLALLSIGMAMCGIGAAIMAFTFFTSAGKFADASLQTSAREATFGIVGIFATVVATGLSQGRPWAFRAGAGLLGAFTLLSTAAALHRAWEGPFDPEPLRFSAIGLLLLAFLKLAWPPSAARLRELRRAALEKVIRAHSGSGTSTVGDAGSNSNAGVTWTADPNLQVGSHVKDRAGLLAEVEARTIQHDRAGRPWLGRVCQVLSYAIILIVPYLMLLVGGAASHQNSKPREGPMKIVGLLSSLICLPLALGLYRTGGRFMATSGLDKLRSDARPPITYLRSFGHDWTENTPLGGLHEPLSYDRMFAAMEFWWAPPQLQEESLADAFQDVGPFVAIGDPRERLPALGAARLYCRDDDWQACVNALLAQSRLVVLRVGTSDGLLWEVERCLRAIPPRRLLLFLGHLQTTIGGMLISRQLVEPHRQAYESFVPKLLVRLRGLRADETIAVPEFRSNATFMAFDDDWRPYIVENEPQWWWLLFPRLPDRYRIQLREILELLQHPTTSRDLVRRFVTSTLARVAIFTIGAAIVSYAFILTARYLRGS